MTDKAINNADTSLTIMLAGSPREEWWRLIDALHQRSHCVLTAPDVQMAAELATIHCVDLVVMDITQPWGLRNLIDFKSLTPSTYDPFIITVIDILDRIEIPKIIASGAKGYLTKPFDFGELSPWIDRAIAEREVRPETLFENANPILDTVDLMQRTNGDLDLIKYMAKAFWTETRLFVDFQLDLVQKPLSEIRYLLHSLAGMAATLGLRALLHQSKEIEFFATREMKNETIARLEALASIIGLSFDRLMTLIAEQENNQD